ncbi:PAS domain S-box protein [Scytonema sp. UIC 10036]|uniref:PAS domain S-box protein n=1 Tax=Scytonema sp. UIC 10036 TaxID=2304196 RepID=UPI0012DA6331|nr:PAS domain S-box protein [Scytonema sp. UIC 10036]MUG93009.1 PAS domain S-box protein [Scytonema sp. UIC 10036]
MNSILSKNEATRLKVLHQYHILDTSPEQAFDDLAFLAARVCAAPIALINFIDANRQWFKAKVGTDLEEMPRDFGICPFCVVQSDVLIILDTLADERFSNSPVVTSAPYVRFYAGVPLIAPEGETIGVLCVVDSVPRSHITTEQLESLKAIARLVMRQLELRRNLTEVASIKTEYKQAQQALRQSESVLRSFFDSSPMMMGVVELVNDDILHISNNTATAKFFGIAPGEMQHRLSKDLGLSQESVRHWLNYYRQAESTQLPVTFEYPQHTFEGSRWLKATVSTIVESSTTARRFAYIVEDVTERKQSEETLRWKEALLRSMTGVSPLAFYVVDHRNGEILYFNERFCEIWKIEHLKTQMECGELKHQDVMEVCHQFTDISPFTSCQSLPSETCDCEDELILNDGRVIRRFSRRIRDENNQYFARLYIFEDITCRKVAEQQIREQAALLDIATDAIVVRDLNNKILLWNKSAEKIYGWEAQEAIGRNANEILYREICPQHLEIFESVLEHGFWQGELQKITKFGQEIIVESRWTLVRDEYSQHKSILVVDTDITQKKQLEKQFLRAQRMESIGTLASGIAHDLNNVLSPILMSVQMLKAKGRDERTQQILTIVENNAKRGAELVKQVLAFARGIEGDRTVLQIKHLISEMKQIVEQTFPKSITLETEVETDLLPVRGDSTQLHQVLMNLCLNARDAMPKGGTLKISAKNILIDENFVRMNLDAKEGSYIVLTITDTGVGIDNKLLDRIFEPFFTTKEFGKGTGLGLSTVMGIVKGHGGFISVSSSIGKGTKFKIYLPAVQTGETQQVENVKVPIGYGEGILVVDDEAAVREITKLSLENHNYKVITASDGIEALAIYAQYKNKISAAIIDMMMPNMDGATTICALQKMNPLLPIIAVSGLTTSEQVPFETKSPITAFLPKPYTAQELLQTLHSVIINSDK